MIYNKGTCFNCGQPSDNYEEIGNTTLYVCDRKECNRELREEMRSYESEKRERADEDNYNRYGY